MRISRPIALLYTTGFLRSLSVGLLGVLLGVYLSRIGFSVTKIGIILGAGLIGISISTALTSVLADRFGRRRTLVLLSLLTAFGGIALAYTHSFTPLVVLAFVSMLNGMGTDRSAIFAIEQAIIPGLVSHQQRTWALSWYNVGLDAAGAIGGLAAGLPILLQRYFAFEVVSAYRYIFLGYTALSLLIAFIYSLLPPELEVSTFPASAEKRVSAESKRSIHRLAALFYLDSFGGGFLGDALVAFWFFRRFGLAEQQLGLLFFVVRVLNALSHLGAAWLARRIGLVNTMIFTHLPSSLFLLAVPLAPNPTWAIILFLLRESLVEMDVPTRQSYVAAIVQPHERTYAAGVTNLTRTLGWASSASIAGVLMQRVTFSAPLYFGGALKIAYDLLLYCGFRKLRPPEEIALRNTATDAKN